MLLKILWLSRVSFVKRNNALSFFIDRIRFIFIRLWKVIFHTLEFCFFRNFLLKTFNWFRLSARLLLQGKFSILYIFSLLIFLINIWSLVITYRQTLQFVFIGSGSFFLVGPPTVAERFLWIWVDSSVFPSFYSFFCLYRYLLGIDPLVFFPKISRVLGGHLSLWVTVRFFSEKSPLG